MERSKQTKLASFASVDQPCFVRIFDATVCRDLVAKDVNSKINVFCGSVRKVSSTFYCLSVSLSHSHSQVIN